ncbi:MAG: ornithine carbamoyltransferase [Gammaproteobacteria bacterium]|jgi:ornithine carbamoyltransferase|nr:ornithine carbamoyltransferase [Gammaproteobacteria bacterium]MBT5202691.1 ornithine carbamoyltransferase [Gammaproteobacteria bacterium]MBT5603287.1 ornithine carbamoyltransferase [Gammaproteobacteria bacterium]MBT6244619.1 ornithine carbamoyltransferase [Gammaproteobacteria bacterium]
MHHLANLKDYTGTEIHEILARAKQIKANPGHYQESLKGKSLAMLFQKTSTRTRVSFEVAMTELGGHSIFIDWRSSNFILSGIQHEIEYLSRNVSCIMARMLKNDDIKQIQAASQVPVINGCCEKYHPCQALTDVFTMMEHTDKALEDVHLVYTGVQNNVSNSLTLIASKLGFRFTLATPATNALSESYDPEIQEIILRSQHINHAESPTEAVQSADFVYTDTWIDMQHFNDPARSAEKEALIQEMQPFQINRELVGQVNCKIMHDMPIHDHYEITPEMVSDPRSIIYLQAANRLHAQKGLLHWLYDAGSSL